MINWLERKCFLLISIKNVHDNHNKISIMKICDNALPIKLFERPNCNEIVDKIVRYAFFIGAFCEGNEYKKPIGYVAFYANDITGRTAFISSICVLDEFQGYSIGGDLLKNCIGVSKEQGMKMIRLEVLKTNYKAISFYKKYGFEFAKEGECTYFMSRHISL